MCVLVPVVFRRSICTPGAILLFSISVSSVSCYYVKCTVWNKIVRIREADHNKIVVQSSYSRFIQELIAYEEMDQKKHTMYALTEAHVDT